MKNAENSALQSKVDFNEGYKITENFIVLVDDEVLIYSLEEDKWGTKSTRLRNALDKAFGTSIRLAPGKSRVVAGLEDGFINGLALLEVAFGGRYTAVEIPKEVAEVYSKRGDQVYSETS